jgi:hypothetical protein
MGLVYSSVTYCRYTCVGFAFRDANNCKRIITNASTMLVHIQTALLHIVICS